MILLASQHQTEFVVATGVRSHRRHLRNEIAIDRELDMLIVDEVDDQTIPELASLLSHFNQAYLGSDTRPALAKHRVSADGAVEQVEPEIEIMGEEKVQRSKRGGTERVPEAGE